MRYDNCRAEEIAERKIADLKQRLEQADKNTNFLLECVTMADNELPEHETGSWQDKSKKLAGRIKALIENKDKKIAKLHENCETLATERDALDMELNTRTEPELDKEKLTEVIAKNTTFCVDGEHSLSLEYSEKLAQIIIKAKPFKK